jgi:trehalose 6-phosphate synthase
MTDLSIGRVRPATVRHAPKRQRLVVVSNRVPQSGKESTGGLATGVLAALKENGGIWFGWSGEIADTDETEPKIRHSGPITFATIDLTQRDYDEYYAGFANRTLWPLFHFRAGLIAYDRTEQAGYQRVNARFARALAAMLQPDDLIWVHDYHLIPLAFELRRLGITEKIGFFLHTPFPPPDLLRVLPNHRQLIEQLCAYDQVGFQTEPDVEAFRDYVLREAGGERSGPFGLAAFGRRVTADMFPIGVDVERIAECAASALATRQAARLAQSLIGHDLIIGVDRLDYSKGLVQRFDAFSRLLEQYPALHRRVTLLQIAPPSRSDVPEYAEIRRALEEATGRINGAYAEPDWTPLRYLNRSFGQRALTGFFRASRVGLVTPFRDGMNLVAKEYVASQDGNDPGVLILSCFAGAARELSGALIVNPYDLDSISEALATALDMPQAERRERWTDMMHILKRNDIVAWRESFLRSLATVGGS